MIRPVSRLRRLLLVGAAVLVAVQCGKEPTGLEGPPPPSKLAFIVQPSNATVGVALAPAIQVAAQDADGGTATGFTGSITIALGANPSGATLSGTTTVNAVAGVATYSNLILGRAANGYTLVASASSLTSATSASFNVATPEPDAVSVFPVDAFVFVGDSVQLAAVATDARGQPIGGVPISWSSSNENVASVDTAGKVRARGVGPATITASAGARSAQSAIQVNRTASVDRRINSATVYPHQEEPFLVIDGRGRLFAGWKEMNTPAGVNRVAFSYSLDGGVSWSTAALVERHPQVAVDAQSDPWLAADENARLYFGRLEGDLSRIVVSHSDDGGLAWSSPVDVLDWDARQLVGLQRVDKPSLAADGNGRVFIAYHGEFSASAPVNVVAQWSTDGGVSWSPSTRMDSSDALQGTTSQAPVMAVSPDGTLYAAWWSRPVGPNNRNGNIVVVASRDRGMTWSGGVRVNPIAGTLPLRPDPNLCCRLPFPSIVVGPGGRVFVAWPDWDGQDWDVMVSWSDDGGASWSTPNRISDVKRGDQWFVALGVDATGTVHAAWYDSRSGGINLVYAKSSDDGRTWSPNVRATTRATPGPVTRLGDYIGIAVGNDGTVYLAWTDGRGPDLDIYFARSTEF